jgi:hypothetical protein
MKNFIKKIFKVQAPVDYVIAVYKPVKKNARSTDEPTTEYAPEPVANDDEMAIDKLYQRN